MTKKQFKVRLEKVTRELADKRDELRDLIDDAEAIFESTDRAYTALQEAADTLSELL